MGKSLDGKVAVITGGSSGIGLAIAERFMEEGAQVVITGRRPGPLQAALNALGKGAIAVQADASDLSDLDALYARVKTKFDRIDILVANAGGGEMAPLGGITEAHFDKTFSTNVRGVVFTVQKALPMLGEGSSVILIGSTAGVSGTPAFSVYSATKAAVRNFARSWILDLKGRGIRINVLSPGPVETPGLLGLAPEGQAAGLLSMFAQSIPLGRVGRPQEIAGAAVFLASDASSFVNGAELFADGGLAQI